MKWAKLFWVTNARGLRQGKVIFVQTFMFQMWLGLIASVNISFPQVTCTVYCTNRQIMGICTSFYG